VTSLDNLQTAGTEREGGKGQESKHENYYMKTIKIIYRKAR
jgi:hypothetical protein